MPLIGQSLTACQILIEDGMRQVGAEPNVIFRTTDNSAVQAMVRSGMAHAVTARLSIDPTDPGIVVREVDPAIPDRTIGLALPHAIARRRSRWWWTSPARCAPRSWCRTHPSPSDRPGRRQPPFWPRPSVVTGVISRPEASRSRR